MSPIRLNYGPHEMDRLETELTRANEDGNPRDFEVWIDREKVIERTGDLEDFYTIEHRIIPGVTKKVQIRIYRAHSNHHTTYTLFVRDEPKTGEGLAGLDFDRRMELERLKWEHKAFEEKYTALEKDRDEIRDYSKELEDEVLRFREKKFHVGDINLLEVGGGLLEGIIRRNPHLLSKIPGGEGLAGAFSQSPTQEGTPSQQSEVHFEEAGEAPEELAKAIDGLADQNKEQLGIVVHHLSQRPDLIGEVLSLIEDEMQKQF